jgi:FkbH-like protein
VILFGRAHPLFALPYHRLGIMKREWHNLSWLPDPPDDFAALCKAAKPGDVEALRRLAAFRLSEPQLNRLARLCGSFAGTPLGFEPFRLGIVGNGNGDFLGPALKSSALRHGVWLDTYAAGMGQIATAVLDPRHQLYQFNPHAVLLALTWRVFPLFAPATSSNTSGAGVEKLKAEVELIRETLKQNSNIALIVQTIPQAPLSLFGSLDRRTAGTVRRTIDDFNAWLFTTDLPVIDTASLAEMVGLATWHDNGQWHWAKLPFSQNLIPLYADHVGRYIGAWRGRSRKCLVLDLDNTLWGGVIGDDGLEGIELGQGSPRGEAFLAVQEMALSLRARGVVLAVCSKNDEKNARLPFSQHPEQMLKEEDIAVFQANWGDKPSNLEAIAGALDLTPEALVFIDDNPVERDMVRREVPTVAVPELPSDEPALWPIIISAAGYFEAVSFTDTDRDRAEQYATNARRDALKIQSRDLGAYLQALEMTMEISSFAPSVRPRVAQLINRSNQYNLTVRRYTEDQLAQMESDSSIACFSARLRDRFGDNGIISVVICHDRAEQWYIDTWLMSCRVLGRQVERALLNHIVATARDTGKTALLGHYVPGPKNSMVEHHYEALGFQRASEREKGETIWRLDLTTFQPPETPIEIATTTARRV